MKNNYEYLEKSSATEMQTTRNMKMYDIMPLPKIEKGEIWQVPLAKLKARSKIVFRCCFKSRKERNEKQNR